MYDYEHFVNEAVINKSTINIGKHAYIQMMKFFHGVIDISYWWSCGYLLPGSHGIWNDIVILIKQKQIGRFRAITFTLKLVLAYGAA